MSDVESSLLRPDRELKGFAKVSLEPGEEREVRIALPARAFEAWDPRVHAWVAEPGDFTILAGASVEDIRGQVSLRLGAPPGSPGASTQAPAILA